MSLSWFIFGRFIYIMYAFYLRERANVLKAAFFGYLFIILISFFAIESLLTPRSYCRISMKWEYRKKDVAVSSIINP